MGERTGDSRTNGVDVRLAPGAGEEGLPAMLGRMIKTNLEDNPERVKHFRALRGTVWVTAEDAGVDMTMVFDGARLTVHPGKVGRAMLAIATDSETLMDLANISIRFGLPYYFDEVGRMTLAKLFRRRLKIRGLFAHPVALTRLTRIMSVR